MRKFNLFPLALAAIAFSACTSEEVAENNPSTGEGTTSYVAVNINSVGTSGSRADSDYADGSDNENKINAVRFYFFTENGDAYKMKEYSSIGKEWYEQVNALEAYCIGKTVSDVSSMQMKEVDGRQNIPAVAELTSSCTISCDQFIAALKKAEANAR